MAVLLTAAQICDEALRNIGSYSVYDTGPDEESFKVTLTRLELLIAEVTGTYKVWWFVPGAPQKINLQVDQLDYDLGALLKPNLQFIQRVFLLRNGKQTELTQVRQFYYECYSEEGLPGTTPEVVYIERNDEPHLHLLTSPMAGDQLLITGQRYSDNLLQSDGQINHGFPASWQRALINQLSADIGSGAVKRIPDNELNGFKKDAGTAFRRLDAFSNKEQVREPRVVRPRSF